MTCGRTDHTKFASAPRAEGLEVTELTMTIDGVEHRFGKGRMYVTPLTNVPAGTYDNLATDRREHYGWNSNTKACELLYWESADSILRKPKGYERRPWGDYPDIPRGEKL